MENRLIKKKRIEEIDIIKALGIILMVAGHSGTPFTRYIYLFHMSVFFIASGFVYKDSSSNTLKDVLKEIYKKIKSLWLPFFLWSSVYYLLNNFFIKINVYTDNPHITDYVSGNFVGVHDFLSKREILYKIKDSALFFGEPQLGGAFWFLRVLFFVSVLYCGIDYVLKKLTKNNLLIAQFVVSAFLLTIGYYCSQHFITLYNYKGLCGLPLAASYYCLYYLGHLLSVFKEKYADWNWKKYITVIAVSLLYLLVLGKLGSIELGANSYVNPAYLIATSLSGWCLLYGISYFIKQIPYVKSVFINIGKNSIAVVILHFLSFKIVATVVAYYYGLPSFCIAAFPNLRGEKRGWWILYIVVGTAVPVLLKMLYNFIVKTVKNAVKKQ